ncbi:YibE/F family protein [Halonatronum saccharophilum]|uniref:YibE/F family protein n=1 Tax=Halonatronum saccharophilum TaxID=150060 RepID=UPI0004B46507|nr:YibE/F family protein [Halonatronum saccharophilum]
MFSKIIKWIFLIAIIILISFGAQNFIPEFEHGSHYQDHEYFRGEVLEVENRTTRTSISQRAKVKVTSGSYQGDKVYVTNQYRENSRHADVKLEEGTRVLMYSFYQREDRNVVLHDIVRDEGLLWAGIILGIALLAIGKIKGLKTIITLVITWYIIVKIMLPMILAGWSPIPVATGSALIIIALTLIIIDGVSPKTIAAFIGTGVGVSVAGLIAYYIGQITQITGLTDELQMLTMARGAFSAREGTINISGLFYTGIIIGSLGAIVDVGMSIASSATQFKKANPDISFQELMFHSLEVGRDIMGTMSNTLILAYVGGSLPMLLLLLYQNFSWVRIVNMDYVAAEILNGIAGSLGLVVAIPVTSVIASLLLGRKN